MTYTNTISENSTYGIQQSYSFTTTPGDLVTPIILACDTIYGSMNIESIVSYAQQQGYNVVAAMNTDFFSMSTGVPLGIVIEDGVYKCSPEGYTSVLFDAQGRPSVVENTAVQIKMTNQGCRKISDSDPFQQDAPERSGNVSDGRAFFHGIHQNVFLWLGGEV